jgi:RNA polymerase sigma factor (sigma-70 family)
MALALDTITFDQLARESAWLGRLARSLVSDPAAAEDAVQDTFVIAAREAPADGRPLRPWLARVLVNRVRMWGRGGARRRKRETAVAELATPPATPDELVARLELQRMVAGFVLELPRAQRDVVLMHYVDGMTSAAIGNRLGISDGTVRWRLKQAIEELRRRLDEKDPKRMWAGVLGALAGGPRAATSGGGIAISVAAIALLIALLVAVAMSPWAPDEPPSKTAPAMTVQRDDEPHWYAGGGAQPGEVPASTLGAGAPFSETQRVSGSVVDDQGHPVAGAVVRPSCFRYRSDQLANVTTNAAGIFVLPRLDLECSYNLTATHDERTGFGWYSPSRPDDRPLVITIFRLSVATLHVVDAETRAPIAGAAIHSGMFGVAGRKTSTEVVTDASGTARVPFDPHFVRVAAAGYASAELTIGESSYFVSYAPVPPPPHDVERTVKLTRGIAVGGVAMAPEGSVKGGRATIYDNEFDGSAELDTNGSFALRVPKPGTYRIEVGAERAHTKQPLTFTVDAAGRTDLVVQLETRESVVGTVIDADGRPIAGATIHLGTRRGATVTDARGHFEVYGFDSYSFDGVAAQPSIMAVLGDAASAWEKLTLDEHRHGEIQLQLGASGIDGVVVDVHGEPVADADVWLNTVYDASGKDTLIGGRGVKSDANGRFHFAVPRGNFVISVRRDSEYDYDSKDDVVIAGGSRNVRLVAP